MVIIVAVMTVATDRDNTRLLRSLHTMDDSLVNWSFSNDTRSVTISYHVRDSWQVDSMILSWQLNGNNVSLCTTVLDNGTTTNCDIGDLDICKLVVTFHEVVTILDLECL